MTHAASIPFPLRIAQRLGFAPAGVFRRNRVGARPRKLLELYSYEGCPMCRRVRRTLSELDLDFLHRSVPLGDQDGRRELLSRGGKLQVPFLVDPNTGREMYESREIIDYLEQHYGTPAPVSEPPPVDSAAYQMGPWLR